MPRLARVLNAVARRAGLEVHRVGRQINKHEQRALLFHHMGVTLVLDVGANVGQYAGTHLRDWTGYSGRIASIEPVEASYRALARAAHNDDAWLTYRWGLSDVDGEVAAIHVPEGQTDLSSLHSVSRAGARMFAGASTVEEVTLHRLDDVIDAIASPGDRLALKLDVQGHEAAVLRGAQRTLERVVLVECEMPLLAMYEGQETFEQLLATLRAADFVPVGMAGNYVEPTTGCAYDADVFFVAASRGSCHLERVPGLGTGSSTLRSVSGESSRRR